MKELQVTFPEQKKGVSVSGEQSFIIHYLCCETLPWVGKKWFRNQMLVAH